METVTRTRSAAALLTELRAAGVPAGPVNDYSAVFADPQTVAREMVMEADHPVAGRIKMIGPAWKMSALRMGVRRPPPLLGQHTAEVLGELGFSPEETESVLAQAGGRSSSDG
jgi:crotonobetainyl-CoA:carnitine CoA-transferase CaiB-like acyl-CoA transferase